MQPLNVFKQQSGVEDSAGTFIETAFVAENKNDSDVYRSVFLVNDKVCSDKNIPPEALPVCSKTRPAYKATHTYLVRPVRLYDTIPKTVQT